MSLSGTFGPHGVFGYLGGEQKPFNAAADIPDLSGKVIAITGGTSGLGRETLKTLVRKNPAQIFLFARVYRIALSSIKLINEVNPDVPITFIECNLASLASVQKAAEQCNKEATRIDVLFNNAGIMCTTRNVTKDGYEDQFATNHVGHALLTKLLLPTLLKTAQEPKSDVRIVFTTSMAHIWTPKGGISFNELKTEQLSVGTWARYGQSKLANILFASELARRYPSIKTISVHPGVLNTNLSLPLERRSFLLSTIHTILSPFSNLIGVTEPEVGAESLAWAATSKKENLINGEFYTPVGIAGQGSTQCKDEKLASQLWDWTEKELAPYMA